MEDQTFYTESSPTEEIVSSFSSEGVVFLKDIIPLSDIEKFYRFAEAHFERSKDARDHFVCVMRSFGRYELTLLDSQNDIPDISRIVNKLEPFIPKLLGGNYKSMLPLKLSMAISSLLPLVTINSLPLLFKSAPQTLVPAKIYFSTL